MGRVFVGWGCRLAGRVLAGRGLAGRAGFAVAHAQTSCVELGCPLVHARLHDTGPRGRAGGQDRQDSARQGGQGGSSAPQRRISHFAASHIFGGSAIYSASHSLPFTFFSPPSPSRGLLPPFGLSFSLAATLFNGLHFFFRLPLLLSLLFLSDLHYSSDPFSLGLPYNFHSLQLFCSPLLF